MHRTPAPRKPHAPRRAPRASLITALTTALSAALSSCQPPAPHPATERVLESLDALMMEDLRGLWPLLDAPSRQELARRLAPRAPLGDLSATEPPEALVEAFAVSVGWRYERIALATPRFLGEPSPAVEVATAGERWRVPVSMTPEGEWRVGLFKAQRAPEPPAR